MICLNKWYPSLLVLNATTRAKTAALPWQQRLFVEVSMTDAVQAHGLVLACSALSKPDPFLVVPQHRLDLPCNHKHWSYMPRKVYHRTTRCRTGCSCSCMWQQRTVVHRIWSLHQPSNSCRCELCWLPYMQCCATS